MLRTLWLLRRIRLDIAHEMKIPLFMHTHTRHTHRSQPVWISQNETNRSRSMSYVVKEECKRPNGNKQTKHTQAHAHTTILYNSVLQYFVAKHNIIRTFFSSLLFSGLTFFLLLLLFFTRSIESVCGERENDVIFVNINIYKTRSQRRYLHNGTTTCTAKKAN